MNKVGVMKTITKKYTCQCSKHAAWELSCYSNNVSLTICQNCFTFSQSQMFNGMCCSLALLFVMPKVSKLVKGFLKKIHSDFMCFEACVFFDIFYYGKSIRIFIHLTLNAVSMIYKIKLKTYSTLQCIQFLFLIYYALKIVKTKIKVKYTISKQIHNLHQLLFRIREIQSTVVILLEHTDKILHSQNTIELNIIAGKEEIRQQKKERKKTLLKTLETDKANLII